MDAVAVTGNGTLRSTYVADGLFIRPSGGVGYDPRRDDVHAQEITAQSAGTVQSTNGSAIINSKTLSYYSAQNEPLVIVTDQSSAGSYPSTNREYIFITNYKPLPEQVTLGQGGEVFSSVMQNEYISTLITCGTVSTTWDTAQDTAVSIFFRITSVTVRPPPPWDCPRFPSATVVTRYRLSASGLALVDQTQASPAATYIPSKDQNITLTFK